MTGRLKKVLIGLIIFFAVFTLFGFFGLPPIAKLILTKKLSEALHRQVTIQQIKANPYALSLTVRGFLVQDRGGSGKFVSFDELYVNLQSISVFKMALVLSEIRLKQPYLNIKRNEDSSYNFSDLLEKKQPKTAEAQAEKPKPLRFSFNNIRIENGSIDFWDGLGKTKHRVTDLNIGVPFLSNIPSNINIFVQPIFSAKIDGAPYEIHGETKPFADSRQTSLDINIKDLNIPYYLAYLPANLKFKISSAYLDTETRISFIEYKEKGPSLTVSGNVSLKKVALDDEKKNPLFRLPLLEVGIAPSEPLKKVFHFSKISIQSPELDVRRNLKGALNIEALLPVKKGAQPPSRPEKKKEEATLIVDVDEVQLTRGKVSFSDLSTKKPFKTVVTPIELKAKNLSTAKNSKGQASLFLVLNKNGTLSLLGAVGVNPLSADLKVTLKNVDLLTYQPYFADRVNIILTGGRLSTAGILQLKGETGENIQITYRGNSSLTNLASIDKVDAQDFLKWKSLALSNMNVGINPFFVNIGGIALTDYYARVIINPNGTVNLQQIMVKKEGETSEGVGEKGSSRSEGSKAAPPEKESPRNIKIEKVTFQGGTVNYSDHFIKPNVKVNMTEVGGRISGLSSEEATTADVELNGKFGEQSSPVEIVGKINPLEKNLYVDLKVSFKDIELSPMSPYSAKYAGYDIEKGQLSLDLKYHIENRKLEAQNRIFIDQFTFGEKVDSPSATKLPVKLAVALLKNRRGEIDLNIPVSGSLDDPKFSIFSIILKVIVNLLTKAATSPFALLGAVFGGGEQLEYMEFDYGSAVIKGENIAKLNTLTKALHDRPALKLDIEGYVDPEKDKESLRQLFFMRKLKAQKLKEMLKKGEPAVPVDEVKIEPQEYEKYLKLAYKAEKFPKPKNFLGMVKNIPGPEMEKLMHAYIDAKEGDLRSLAGQRAMNVKEAIVKSGEVGPERVFVVGAKTLAPPKRDNLKESRVEFKLK
jgi:hypothetical protein